MAGNRVVLLDETDIKRRLVQHGAVLAGIVVLALAGAVASLPGRRAAAVAMIGADEILVLSDARLTSFRCRIVVAEVRLRGLKVG